MNKAYISDECYLLSVLARVSSLNMALAVWIQRA